MAGMIEADALFTILKRLETMGYYRIATGISQDPATLCLNGNAVIGSE